MNKRRVIQSVQPNTAERLYLPDENIVTEKEDEIRDIKIGINSAEKLINLANENDASLSPEMPPTSKLPGTKEGKEERPVS